MRLVDGLWDRGHLVTMDNFFSNIGFFKELLARGIFAFGIFRSNRVGIPSLLKNTRAFKNSLQGTILWRMYDSCTISCVM